MKIPCSMKDGMMNIPYAKHEITDDDIKAVTTALSSQFLTGGPQLVSFEEKFASYVEAPHAIGVANGTAALQLAVATLGLTEKKTVIVPSLTFAASANAVLYNGGGVEFVDIKPDTLLLDIDAVEEKIAHNPSRYAGVVAVDFAGYPLDVRRLARVCHENDMWLVEDAAHALGARYSAGSDSMAVGSGQYADMTTFSFHPAKHITTGEGGMITTGDSAHAAKLRKLRSHGMDRARWIGSDEPWRYDVAELGYNVRMSEIVAALGKSQLSRIESNIATRGRIAQDYQTAFADNEHIRTPNYDSQHTNANHLFIVQVPRRLHVYTYLMERGIATQVHYTPLHMQPLYKGSAGEDTFPHTEKYYRECLSLPMFPTLTQSEQDYVISTLQQAVL